MAPRSTNKQLLINLLANIIGFLVNIGIQFFLTPFIVKSLGVAAYGFVGLSSNIIMYTQLISTALNSMSGRYITIKYTEGDVSSANKYFSSVFYSNIILSIFIGIALFCAMYYIEAILNVPQELLFDVKLLLFFLSVNYIFSLLTNVYSLATFVKNRLDLSSIVSIIANVSKTIILCGLFALCVPHIWYIGLAGTVYTLYISLVNIRFSKRLTPEFIIKKQNYDWAKVKELIFAGIWNTISQLGTILGQGLDLIIANLFIGATAMGVFSISRQIPFFIISFCGAISAVFAPSLTQYFAKNEIGTMKSEINKSIRILSLFVTIPLVFMLIFGNDFFALWVPSEDNNFLHLLSILCGIELIISLPLEVLWSVFMITNQLKFSTLFMLGNHLLTFIIVLLGVHFSKSAEIQLIILASTRTVLGLVRSLTFLPLYGAWCLRLSYKTFYHPIIKVLISFLVSSSLCLLIRFYIDATSWRELVVCGVICIMICSISSMFLVLTKTDRNFIKDKILQKIA